jgi:hypothetical protein
MLPKTSPNWRTQTIWQARLLMPHAKKSAWSAIDFTAGRGVDSTAPLIYQKSVSLF